MFSYDMPRAAALTILLALASCAVQDPVPVLEPVQSPARPLPQVRQAPVREWLLIQAESLALTSEQAIEQREAMTEVPGGGVELFRYGLLNHQVIDYNYWI